MKERRRKKGIKRNDCRKQEGKGEMKEERGRKKVKRE
jgi:hypothetical protein